MLLIQGKSPPPEVHFCDRRDYSSSINSTCSDILTRRNYTSQTAKSHSNRKSAKTLLVRAGVFRSCHTCHAGVRGRNARVFTIVIEKT